MYSLVVHHGPASAVSAPSSVSSTSFLRAAIILCSWSCPLAGLGARAAAGRGLTVRGFELLAFSI